MKLIVNNPTSFPSNWSPVSNNEDYNLITVSFTSTEAKEVLADFQKKLGRPVTHFGVRFFYNIKFNILRKYKTFNFFNGLVATNSKYKSLQTVCST